MNAWRPSTWGDEISLEYGKALRGYESVRGSVRVFGSNGPVGWTDKSLATGPGVILGRKGAYRGVQYSEGDFFVIDTAYYVVPKTDLDMRWLYYAIQYHKLGEIDDGSPIPSTTRAAVYVRELDVPPKDVQREIARVLGSIDDKIDLNRRINQTLETMAQAIFKSWFVDFDPVKAKIVAKQEGRDPLRAAMSAISGKSDVELDDMPREQYQQLATTAALFPDELQDSELGEIPKGWQVALLGEHLTVLETGSRPKGGVGGISDGVPSVGAENILGVGNYNFGKEKFVTREFFEKMRRGKVCDFDFLLYKDGGKPGDFKPRVSLFGCGFPYDEFAINEHVFRIRSENLGQSFLYFQVGDERVLAELRHKGAKAAIPGINQGDVNSIRFIMASSTVLAEFNRVALKNLELILTLAKESRQLGTLRDALLPKLLSGELSVADVMVENEA